MAVSYVTGSSSITASRMNALWSELDRKMTLLMDGKSWFMFEAPTYTDLLEGLTGKAFFFTDIAFGRIATGLGGTNYDHTLFTAGVAAATAGSPLYGLSNPDHTYKITFLNFGFVADKPIDSLEAHKISTLNGIGVPEDYWVWDDNAVMPEKRYRYAVAELIFEHAATSTHTIPNTYDKYNHFRIHNLNSYSIDVTFEAFPGMGSDVVVTVPPWECRCVQRPPGGALVSAYNYFFKATGDTHRVLTLRTFGAPAGHPIESSLANNVVNHQLIFHIITLFSSPTGDNLNLGYFGNVRWICDPHEQAYSIYSSHTDYFSDPSNPATICGDILHHKGRIDYLSKDAAGSLVRNEGEFNGYSDLATLISTTGLTVVSDASGVTIQGTDGDQYNDVISPGTNLLYSDLGDVVTAYSVTSAVPIEFKLPVAASYPERGMFPLFRDTQSISNTYAVYTLNSSDTPVFDHDETVAYTEEFMAEPVGGWTGTIKPHIDTIATALTFNCIGNDDLAADDQDSDLSALTNRRMVLTAFGPVFLWEQEITLDSSINRAAIFFATAGPHTGPYTYLESGKLVQHRLQDWGGYGWQQWPTVDFSADGYNGSHGGFISPRRTRAVDATIAMQSLGAFTGHPNVNMPIWNEDGADFEIQMPAKTESEIVRTLFTPDLASPLAGHWPVWVMEDYLYEYETIGATDVGYLANRGNFITPPASNYMPRVKLLKEHYNTMAAWVNSIKKARPFTFRDVQWYLAATTESVIGVQSTTATVYDYTIAASSVTPGLGSFGILSTTVRPKDCYASFVFDSPLYRLFDELGVTIKGVADLHSNYASLIADPRGVIELDGTYDEVVTDTVETSPGVWDVYWRREITSTDFTNETFPSDTWKLDAVSAPLALDSYPPGGGYPSDTDPMSPTYLQLNLSDWYWVSVADMKTAAEALGFKFLYEELSDPCDLVSHDASSVAAVVDHSEKQVFVVNPGPPPAVGTVLASRTFGTDSINDILNSHTILTTEKSLTMWVSSDTPNWKRDYSPYPTIADTSAGDVLTFFAPRNTAAACFIFKSVFDAEVLNRHRSVWTPPIETYRRRLMFTSVASTGITKANYAIKIPTPWYKHPDPNFSELAEVNARSRFVGSTIPFEVEGAFGAATIEAISGDYAIIEPGTDEGFEVLIWNDTYVDCT